MVQDQVQTRQEDRPEDDNVEKPPPRYFVDVEAANAQNRALPVLIASRRCHACQQADDEQPSASSDVKPYAERIAEHCGQTSDYLLPDTPLKEAIFRVLLAGSNEPMTADEISQIFTEKWELTAYPRDVSPGVIQRLLDHSESYCIARLPEPEAEEGDEAEETPDDPPAEDPPEDA